MNTNCLEGFRCPQCGQTEKLAVLARMWVALTDDGTDPYDDAVDNMGGTEWDDDSPAECPNCGHAAKVLTFFKGAE